MKYFIATFVIVFIFLTGSLLLQKGNPPPQKPTPTNIPSPEVAGVTDIMSTPTPSLTVSSPPVNQTGRETVQVLKVIDGDTIQISGNRTLRYIGIDTPESVDPRRPVQCFGKEATQRNRELVEGKIIGLEKDVSETDRYGRLLRYVYLNNTLINEQLVQEGYAYSSAYPPDIGKQARFDAAEQQAREQRSGLWGVCEEAAPRERSTQNGDDKDCGDFQSQAEAQAYFESKGGSSTNNVDKLDGSDGDGQVCETLP